VWVDFFGCTLWRVERIASATTSIESAKRPRPAKIPDLSYHSEDGLTPSERPGLGRYVLGRRGFLVYTGGRGIDDQGGVFTTASFATEIINGIRDTCVERSSGTVTIATGTMNIMVLVIISLFGVLEVTIHRRWRSMRRLKYIHPAILLSLTGPLTLGYGDGAI
jgi:hypothetical protein